MWSENQCRAGLDYDLRFHSMLNVALRFVDSNRGLSGHTIESTIVYVKGRDSVRIQQYIDSIKGKIFFLSNILVYIFCDMHKKLHLYHFSYVIILSQHKTP